ncbi:DoxX family protein [Nocardia sp. NBC_01327]|uniref:DoxX family protein n=1 Tax=Nocardia sp. NBC_01327 TaxID=2903593 RepID=UPI002E0E76B8|nr:DoxX family protein [Nocardia sp. NBC_01327]
MHIAYIAVTIAAALWVGFSAVSLLRRAAFVVDPLVEYGVPQSWWTPLGIIKALGAIGLIAGLYSHQIGIAAAIGIILYFVGAVITVLRARSYKTVAFPILYLIPVAVALGLGAAAA